MKVYDRNLTGAAETNGSGAAQRTQKTASTSSSQKGGGGGAGGGDRVELSTTLSRLSRALAAESTERKGRVQSLATQYQSGLYQADVAATSAGIVSEALSAGLK